jgi:hypothetical protein
MCCAKSFRFGLQINGGHEVMMDRCWLGETNFDFDHEKHNVTPNATVCDAVEVFELVAASDVFARYRLRFCGVFMDVAAMGRV